jgi:predicted transport protein
MLSRHPFCVAHEYSTGQNHKGRIDTLGLDENCCPVIIEYKRHSNENVINQGLYYLDWLLDHKAEFKLLVMERFDKAIADDIEWDGTRVICVAGDFTKFDEHAIAQIGRNIELIRYKYFSNDLLMLEWLNPVSAATSGKHQKMHTDGNAGHSTELEPATTKKQTGPRTFAWHLAKMPDSLRPLYDDLIAFGGSLGDDVNVKEMRRYLAFTRLKNFVCLLPMVGGLKLWVKLNPDTVQLEEGFSRDLRGIGHWGTGDLEVYIRNEADFAKAKSLIERAYQEN